MDNMILEQLIKQIPNWQTAKAADIVTELNAVTEIIETNKIWTWIDIARIEGVGAEVVGKLHQVLRDGNFEPFALMLAGPGLALNDELLRTVLKTLISVVPETEVILKAAKRDASKWQKAGNEGDVTEAQVKTVLDKILVDDTKQTLMQSGATRWNTFVAAINSWDGSGIAPVL